jgi:curved DNA-binding protein CbpA
MSGDEAARVLGVADDAGVAQVRAAYLAKVAMHPPDRDPEQFERVRDAYHIMRDPRRLALQILQGSDASEPFIRLLDQEPLAQRRFVGKDLWLSLLKEKRQ